MIEHDISAHFVGEFIKRFRRPTFEKAVFLARLAHAVNHFAPFVKFIHHFVYGIYIVLQVGVHGNNRIGILCRRFQSRKQCVLVSAVARKIHARKMPVLFVKLANQRPGVVFRAVVHVQHAAFVADFARADESRQLFTQTRRSFGKHRFFVVTRHNYVQNGIFHFLFLSFNP